MHKKKFQLIMYLLGIVPIILHAPPKQTAQNNVAKGLNVAKGKKLSKEQEEDALLERTQKEVQATQATMTPKRVEEKVTISKQDFNDLQELFLAMGHFDLNVIKIKLLKNKKIINLPKSKTDRTTPLTYAVQIGSKAIVSTLLDHGADTNLKGAKETTALMYAAYDNHKDIAVILLDHGADTNLKNDKGDTALIFAAQNGHKDIIAMLLSKKADPNLQNNLGKTALMQAAQQGYDEIVKMLLDKKADPNLQSNAGATALIVAALTDREKIVQNLLSKWADPYLQSKDGSTALMYAKNKGFVAIAKIIEKYQLAYDLKQKNKQKLLQTSYEKWQQFGKGAILKKESIKQQEDFRKHLLEEEQKAIDDILKNAHVAKQDVMRRLLESQENQEQSDKDDFFEEEIIGLGRPYPVPDWSAWWNPEDFERAQRIMQGSD